MLELSPEKGRIFRITHMANVPWILDHGLHCQNSPDKDPDYVTIGNPSLIDKRARRAVPISPHGFLSDYVPFYFTPRSIMLYNIITGCGVPRHNQRDIVMIVSSVRRLRESGLPFVYTNQHAYPVDTDYYDGSSDLSQIDWELLRSCNFKTDDADPGKQQRYHAEALVHRHVPVEAFGGVACYNDAVARDIQTLVDRRGLRLHIRALPGWYFPI